MTKSRIRLAAVQLAFAVGVALVVARAAQVQLLEGAGHAETARNRRTVEIELPAPRGPILDRNGTPLAITHEVYHLNLTPAEVRDTAGTIDVLAKQLDLPARVVRREFRKQYGYLHGPYSATAVQPLRGRPGIHLDAELERFHPSADLARTVLGYPEAPGRPASGLERVFDSLLTGVNGSAVQLRDRSGNLYESPSRLDAFPTPGHQVFLTIDAQLQEIVEEALLTAIETLDASGGDVVALNPATGEILAMASFDHRGQPTVGAFGSAFEPGSTAKVFVLAALLEEGLAKPSERINTENGRYEMEYRVVLDDHPSDWLTLSEVIKHSSNIGMVKFASRLSPGTQFTMMRAFGLGTRSGLELPVESQGTLKPPHRWSGTTASSLAMGYEVAVSPVQLAQAYATIANDGLLLRPTLVREIRDARGTTTYRHEPEPIRRVTSAAVARTIRDMLEEVVLTGGTGETAALSTYEVAGKTGTAKRAEGGVYVEGSYTASFASVFPAADPQLVMVVKFDDPESVYARWSAAPVTKEVLERLLATRSPVLNQQRLASVPPVSPRAVPAAANASRVIVPWPRPDAPDVDSVRAVPDVSGLSLRAAVRTLHAAGFRVHVRGWGTAEQTTPAAGDTATYGTPVTIVAAPRTDVP